MWTLWRCPDLTDHWPNNYWPFFIILLCVEHLLIRTKNCKTWKVLFVQIDNAGVPTKCIIHFRTLWVISLKRDSYTATRGHARLRSTTWFALETSVQILDSRCRQGERIETIPKLRSCRGVAANTDFGRSHLVWGILIQLNCLRFGWYVFGWCIFTKL